MGKLTGKVAIVTGASRCIGAGIAKGMSAAGAAVVANCFSSKEGVDLVVADIVGSNGKRWQFKVTYQTRWICGGCFPKGPRLSDH
jgi:NAD(P)-dependent dehydrogenase (short-subunit alcohol dehydrogenase family)